MRTAGTASSRFAAFSATGFFSAGAASTFGFDAPDDSGDFLNVAIGSTTSRPRGLAALSSSMVIVLRAISASSAATLQRIVMAIVAIARVELPRLVDRRAGEIRQILVRLAIADLAETAGRLVNLVGKPLRTEQRTSSPDELPNSSTGD